MFAYSSKEIKGANSVKYLKNARLTHRSGIKPGSQKNDPENSDLKHEGEELVLIKVLCTLSVVYPIPNRATRRERHMQGKFWIGSRPDCFMNLLVEQFQEEQAGFGRQREGFMGEKQALDEGGNVWEDVVLSQR